MLELLAVHPDGRDWPSSRGDAANGRRPRSELFAVRTVHARRPARAALAGQLMLGSLLLVACNPSGVAGPSPSTDATASASPVAPSQAATTAPAPSSAPPATAPPSPGGSAGATFHVDLATVTGPPVSIEVKDESGRLVGVASGTPGDGVSVPMGSVEIANDGPSTLRLIWAGPPCATELLLLIDATASLLTVVQPECTGDSIAFDRVLDLTFAGPVSAGDVNGVIQTGIDTPG